MIIDLLTKEYMRVGSDICTPLLDCLISARSHFGGDLDLLIIHMVIGLRTLQDPRTAELSLQAVADHRVASLPSLFTNIRSIAASTGIPYETVRRKVACLVERGWVRREGDKLALTVQAMTEFTQVRNKMLVVTASNHAVLSKLLKGAG